MDKIYLFSAVFFPFLASYFGNFNIGMGIATFLLFLIIIGILKNVSLNKLLEAGIKSGKKAFLVLKVFALVGMISSLWINSGTIPGIVYYGVSFINPSFFYLLSFLIACTVSSLLGSSFGTVGTVGIALMAVGRGIGIDVDIAGGALIAGAFFGDRCSPVSSSANLVAVLTESDLYENIRNMFKTGIIPLFISSIIYFILGFGISGEAGENLMGNSILEIFPLPWVIFLPVIAILVSSLFRLNVKTSMFFSIFTAALVAYFFQGFSAMELLKSAIFGFTFREPTSLESIFKGGGLISMWKAALVVFVSCFMAGIIEILNLMKGIEKFLFKGIHRGVLFFNTLIVSILTSAAGCNQSIAVVMTTEIMKPLYKRAHLSAPDLAVDIENSSIIIPPLIPWNIAGLIPAGILGLTSLKYIGYSFYLYVLPLTYLVLLFLKNKRDARFHSI